MKVAKYGLAVVILCFLYLSIETSASPVNRTQIGKNQSATLNCSTPVKKPNEKHKQHKKPEKIALAKLDFSRVQTPFTVALWILLGSTAKLVFHLSGKLASIVPESCLLILLGIPIGLILNALGFQETQSYFTSNVFFLFLLPPIILDAGYFMPVRIFYRNIGTILLYATIGTVFNCFTVGLSLYGVQGAMGVDLPLLHGLLFGSFIAAVDPVAVLAVFEEVHVHEILYILVFGESVLNDAASVVLYHTFEALASMPKIAAKDIGLAFLSFFVVSLGGTFIGLVWGLATAFITRFTEHVRVIEPIFVFIMAYMAYLTAEIFHFSGIMSILFCGMIMKPYVESNVSRKSHTTIKYFLKLLATSSETVIFMFLGVSLVVDNHLWNTRYVVFTLLFMLVFRTIGVIILTATANTFGRLIKINKVEQFIMSYGGLRGAVAFCLAILLDSDHIKLKELFVTTTIAVILFTVFIQGITIKPLVRCLRVRRAEKREKSMTEQVNEKLMDHLVAGVEGVLGHHGHGFWWDLVEYYNRKYLRRWLERDPDMALDEELVMASRRLAFKNALCLAENPHQILQKTDEWSCVRRNPSYAFALALRANNELDDAEPQLDINVMSGRSSYEESDAFLQYNVSSLLPKAKRSVRHRASVKKYSLAALGEGDDELQERYRKVKRNALAHMAPAVSNHRHRNKHRRHPKRGSSKKPVVDTLPEVAEDELDGSNLNGLKDENSDDGEGIVFSAKRKKSEKGKYDDFIVGIPLTDFTVLGNGFDDKPRKDSGADVYFMRHDNNYCAGASSIDASPEKDFGLSDNQGEATDSILVNAGLSEAPAHDETDISITVQSDPLDST